MFERVRSLYGAADGTWLFVETPHDVVPDYELTVGIPSVSPPDPGEIRTLNRLGPPYEVFLKICQDLETMPAVGLRGRTGKMPIQQALGEMFGVSQQSISRYIDGSSEPDFSGDQWHLFVRIYHDPNLALSAVQDYGLSAAREAMT